MLGVLKRRWKPKRASNAGTRYAPDLPSMDVPEKPARISASVRQVHPVCEEKAQVLAYEKNACVVAIDSIPPPPPPPVSANHRAPIIDHCGSSPVSAQTQTYAHYYSKRASIDSNPSPVAYPLTPNICVESGRIEFIKTSGDVATIDTVPTPPATPKTGDRITVTRGSQTETIYDEKRLYETKEKLEIRVAQLEAALESAQTAELRDKQVLSKLQRQLSRRESSQRDADRERRLRAESEARTKQALQEAARCRARLRLLTNEFTRMEETVRSMLVYKSRSEQLRQEKTALTVAFENRCQQYQNTITRLNHEISSLREQLDQINLDPSLRDGAVAAQTAALHKQAEESRRQYERCLDDVANQVVKALLAQKGLKEEISNLNKRIQDLESQNHTLTSMLVHQLRGDSTSLSDSELSPSRRLALEEYKEDDATSADASPSHLLTSKQLSDMKHCNSFNSDVLNDTKSENFIRRHEKHLSADSNVVDNKLSLDDKKRHQVLTRLWTELKGAEVTPKRLLEALSAVDPSFRLPPQRPVSLNLHLPIFQTAKGTFRSRPVLAQTCSKSEEETTGNESPESGNRDEGYSTMSSDVQAEVTKTSSEATVPARGLEELKEVIDETDIVDTRLLVTETQEPDVLYIPINLLGLNPRNSYPPTKDILPFQHIMRSFSDSHLCIKITTSPSPCYSLSSPISSSPSILLLDITEKKYNPLRRTKATSSLVATSTTPDFFDDPSPALEEHLECASWDAEYIQHWLLLDETRSAIQQHQRDLLELEYDRTELEDWSLSLSSDDVRTEQMMKKYESVTTPGQISLSTLPSIQENNALELEEDANECLWNGSSYMVDRDGHEIVTLLMDTSSSVRMEKQWPYAVVGTGNNPQMANSPENSSWSSNGSDCCHSYEPETCSKRSSAALSGCSDDTSEMPAIGTDFTRDFYRLVKFESTKSLASTSSRSLGGALSENGDREMALQNVLTFIAEQQKYTQNKESRPCSVTENTKDFNVEAPRPVSQCFDDSKNSASVADENYSKLKHLTSDLSINAKNEDVKYCNISYAEEVCLVTPLDVESENCSNMSVHPVDICSSVNVDEISSSIDATLDHSHQNSLSSDINKSCDSDNATTTTPMSESLTSTVSTPDTVVSKIPRLKPTTSKIPVSPNRNSKVSSNNNNNNKNNNVNNNEKSPKLPRSKIPYKKLSTPTKHQTQAKTQSKNANEEEDNIHVITAERLPRINSCGVSSVIEGPPHRAVSFHERATSKDVIDELNRIIQKGEEGVQQGKEDNGGDNTNNPKLDENCKSTGWIHVEKDIDLTDPKARANLLDVMMASVSSDSSPTSSCGGSITSDSNEEPPDYGHLHRIHKFHRQKKVHAHRPELAVVRMPAAYARPSIIGRPDFYVRYGEKEQEAVACFDFLDNFSSGSSSSNDKCSISNSSSSCSLHNEGSDKCVEDCVIDNDMEREEKGMVHACYNGNDGMIIRS